MPTTPSEVWIRNRGDALRGTGTIKDPFNGNTMDLFDSVMASLPATVKINIAAGLFRGNVTAQWRVKPGWNIQGAGMYDTIIQMGGNARGVRQRSVLFSDFQISTDLVIVRDLSCDANWAELRPTADDRNGEKYIKTGGVAILGSNNLIERVRSINSYGSMANGQEQFSLILTGRDTLQRAHGNKMLACRVELPAGNYGSPFALFSTDRSTVKNCTAIGINNGLNGGFNSGGVNLAANRLIKIIGNTFEDCMGAAYHDTDTIDAILLENNKVIRGWAGFLNNSPNADKNISLINNYFDIQTRNPFGPGFENYGVYNVGNGGTLDTVMVRGNTIVRNSVPGHGSRMIAGVAFGVGVTNADILNNTVDGTDENFAPGCRCSGNRDRNGRPVPGLLDNFKVKT